MSSNICYLCNEYNYLCDAGSLRIGNEGFDVFFHNGYGDGYFDLSIYDGLMPKEERNELVYITSFIVKTGQTANVYKYDCSDEPYGILTTLNPGKYFIYHGLGEYAGNMVIEKHE